MAMAHRDWGQLGFADHMVLRHDRPNELLTRLAELIDWARLRRIVSVPHDSPQGAPPYPPPAMVKALLLQQWYGLSDPGLEEALWDLRAAVGRDGPRPFDAQPVSQCAAAGWAGPADL
jgi:IS5 family transposase